MRWLKHWMAYAFWRVRAFVYDNVIKIVLSVLIVAALILYWLPDIIVTINPGESGVLWRRFGGGTVTVASGHRPFLSRLAASRTGEATALDEEGNAPDGYELWPYSEGTHWKWPWNRVYRYNLRLQEVSANYDALTNDGLAIKVEVTIRWKPIEADLGKLHREIGPDYVNTLLIPLVGSFARHEIAAEKPDALYSPQRLEIQERIRERTKQALVLRFHPEDDRESYLMLEDVLIRNVELPDDVAEAIERKVVEKQQAEAYEYRLSRERQEADRKAIEAEGIRRFQETINSTISPGYLKWKGIDATLELAKSSNAKVVVIGAGTEGMPIILGGLDGTAPPALPSRNAASPPATTAAKPSPAQNSSPAKPASAAKPDGEEVGPRTVEEAPGEAPMTHGQSQAPAPAKPRTPQGPEKDK